MEGVTCNASRSGVLFRCARPLDVGTAVHFILGLSLEGAAPSEAADMMCEGHVVRARTDSDEATVAATIKSYSYIRKFLGKQV